MPMGKIEAFLSRRGMFVALGGFAAAAIAVVSRPLQNLVTQATRNLVSSQPTLRRMFLSLADGSYQEWADQVGTIFSVGGGAMMKLVAVEPFYRAGVRPANVTRSLAFMAKFDLLNHVTLPGDLIYLATNPSYGTFRIFLSASSDPRQPQRMNALFN